MSKNDFDLVSALKRIVNTVEDSYIVYEDIVKKISKDDLQFLNSVFSELNDPQDLISKYLNESYDEHGNFYYNYKRGFDDRKINTKKSKPHLSGDMYDNIAALRWIDRKKKELLEIKKRPILKGALYPTLRLKTDRGQKIRLLNLLKESFIIDNSTKIETLTKALSGDEVYEKPKIRFLKKRQILTFLILKLKLNDTPKYNEIIYRSEIFIYKDGKKVRNIKSAVDDYKHLSDKEFKPKHIIDKLNVGLNEIFSEHQLRKLPYKAKN